MRTTTQIFTFMMVFAISQLSAQTAKEKRDSSMNELRAKHLVERFERSVAVPDSEVQEKIRKSKARKLAILWCIDNSGLKEKKKEKLRKALKRQTASPHLKEFVAQHKERIEEYLEETTNQV